MSNKVTASAPGKLMLAGSYAVVHGRPCVVTAVDQRLYVTIESNGDDQFHFSAPDLGLKTYTKSISQLGDKDLPKEVRFIETLYKSFLEQYPQDHGISVTTKSDFSSTVGFGSSSAVTVAFAKALLELYQVELTHHEVFQLCYETVIKVQGVGSGFDLAAAIWGGTLKYVTPATVVEPIELPADVFSDYLVVGYTGEKADTPTLVRMINGWLEAEPDRINTIFDEIGQQAEAVSTALQNLDWDAFGTALSGHQAAARKLGISTPSLETLILSAIEAGSLGSSLSGAGGGDCMVAVTSPKTKAAVVEAMNTIGEVIPVGLHAEGVRIEKE